MKQFNLTVLLAVLMSMVSTKAFAYDIAVENADGVTIYYNYINNKTELEVTYYGKYRGSVVIPESVAYEGNTYPVTAIGGRAFYDCSSLTEVTIPGSVTSIGNYAFCDCSSLTEVTIPGSVTSIGNYAFCDCSSLTEVTIPGSVTSIGNCAFGYCSSLTEVTIPNSVTSIGDYAFGYCSSLTEVTIPNSVTSIGDYAFEHCSSLTEVTIPNSVTSIGERAFYYCSLESVTIGSGVLSIGWYAFYSPAKVIWLTNTPPSGYEYAEGTVNYVANEQYSSLRNKTVYPFLSSMFEVDGVKYVPVSPSERTCDAIDCAYNESAENIHIGNTVTNMGISLTVQQIHPYAFYNNKYIKNVELELDGDVGDYAFYGCTDLENAILGEQITSLGNGIFGECYKLQSITIPDAVQTLGSNAFDRCQSLVSAKIGTGIQAINNHTFSDCSSLTEIEIPLSVTKIGIGAFYGCSQLRKVVMADGESELQLEYNQNSYYNVAPTPMFADCPLNMVYIGRNISYDTSNHYGYSPFYRNTTLTTVVITDIETEIPANEFYGCSGLKNVTIGNSVTSIGDWAFSGCSSLESFEFGSAVKTIGQETFSDCAAMTRLISHADTPPVCGIQALDDINKWACTLSVPQGHTAPYQQADQWKEFFFINDDVSGISSPLNANPRTGMAYTISGQGKVINRGDLRSLHKGIYIIDGVKHIVK